MIGWGAIDNSGEQSRYPRQVILPFNMSSNANSSARYFLQTNVGPNGEDACKGDSGWTLNLKLSLESLGGWFSATIFTYIYTMYNIL